MRRQAGIPKGFPAFVVRVLDDGVSAYVTCPRTGCGETAGVSLTAWLAGRRGATEYGTRSCTYCFGTAKIPDELKEAA